MAYSPKGLAEDESIVLDLHPHWKALVAPVVVLLAVCAGASFGIAATPDYEYDVWARAFIVVVAVAVLAVWSVVPFLRWRTTHFVVTDRRVLVRTGILARQGRDVPLSRINDITFSHTVVERVLRCGTLVIESAGERGQVTLEDVPHVEDVQRTVYELVESTDDRLSGGHPDH
jgi:uncharacterized membrane protein YdbT with pleckstrin-like domain